MRWNALRALVVSAVLATTAARAQGVDSFGCSDDDYAGAERPYSSLLRTSEFRLRRLVSGERTAAGLPTLTLGPFADQDYCFRTAEVFATDSVPEVPRGTWRRHMIELAIHLTGPEHDSWWTLEESDGRPLVSSVMGSENPALEGVAWALPTANEPVIEVSIRSDAAGLGQRSTESRHLILDLRPPTARVLAEYVCGGADYAGMPCSWGDEIPEKGGFSCVWAPSFGDYHCTTHTRYELPWIVFSRQTCFPLTTGRPSECETTHQASARPLTGPLVEAMTSPTALGTSFTVDGLGVATVIGSAPATPAPGGWAILAVPSDELEFDPLLYLATTIGDGRAHVQRLDIQWVVAAAQQGPSERHNGPEEWHAKPTSPDAVRVVSSTAIAGARPLQCFRVVLEQGKARALIFVGVEFGAAGLRAGAVVAAIAAEYRGLCGAPFYPSTGVALRLRDGALPVTLDVEPDFQEGGVQGRQRRGVPTEVEVRWDPGRGFVLEKLREDRAGFSMVRRVSVADDGTLSFKATRIDEWQSDPTSLLKDGCDVARPSGPPIVLDGALYGVTADGGEGSAGTIYALRPDPAGYVPIRSFFGTRYALPTFGAEGGLDGKRPIGPLVALGGALYGMTSEGGTKDHGTIFRIDPDGRGFVLLHEFLGSPSDGDSPLGSLTILGGGLYGTTSRGGVGDGGTVFRINPDGTGYAVLHSFTGVASAALSPEGSLLALDGALFGVTARGGVNRAGTLFRLNRDGGGFTILHSFGESPQETESPVGGLTAVSGVVCGMTSGGAGRGRGAVFRINKDGSGFEVLHPFEGGLADGGLPSGSLVAWKGALFGATLQGGNSGVCRAKEGTGPFVGCGTVFKITPETGEFTLLHAFTGEDGILPGSITASGGVLYGTTQEGGAHGRGTVFKVNSNGTGFATLHSFGCGTTTSAR